jgi:hypothetical protein
MKMDVAVQPQDDELSRVNTDGSSDSQLIRDLYAHRPGLREAFQARMQRVPEYRVSLQQFVPGVLSAVEELGDLRTPPIPDGQIG